MGRRRKDSGRTTDRTSDHVYTVYCLAERSAGWRVRYIGITKQQLSRRLLGHLWDAKRPYRQEHKTNWIRRCMAGNVRIQIRLLRTKLNLVEACALEQRWIAKYADRLVNIHEGGTTGYTGLPMDAKDRHRDKTRLALANIPMEVRLSAAKKARDANSAQAKARRAARTAPSLYRGGYETDGVFGRHEVRLFAPTEIARMFSLVIDGEHRRSRTQQGVIHMLSRMLSDALRQTPDPSRCTENQVPH